MARNTHSEVAINTHSPLLEDLESQKKSLRAKIKIARNNMTIEANQWEKQITKYETKAKEGRLTNSTRSLLRSTSEVSQELLWRQLAVVTGALEELLFMCRNFGCANQTVLDGCLDDLVRELEDQKDAVSEAIEELGDRTENLLIQQEENMVVEGTDASRGVQAASKKSWTFKNMTHIQPAMLVKEVRPAELHAWEEKFDSWMSHSLQGTAPSDFAVSTFLSLCDAWWVNRLLPKKRDSTTLGDLRGFVREEMKVLFRLVVGGTFSLNVNKREDRHHRSII